eukprot:Skav222234  [mRNA]  locus=scaffold3059:18169:18966:- [translate_table: standard]
MADTTALNSTLSRQTVAHIHMNWLSFCDQFSAFLVIVRNPVSRTVSQFYYSQSIASEEIPGRVPMPMNKKLHACYKTMDDVANGMVGADGVISHVQNSSSIRCPGNARRVLSGLSNEGSHFRFNLEFFAKQIMRLWPRKIFVLRNEHLWDDYSRLDFLLGGSGVRPLDIHVRDFGNKSHTGHGPLNSRSRGALCWLLCREIYFFKVLLLESKNLNATEIQQSIDDLEQTCPGSSLMPPFMSQRFTRKPRLETFRSFGVCTYVYEK